MSKWQDISTLIYSTLSSYAPLTALLSNGADSIYPLVADAEEGDTFITYSTSYEGKPSKDGAYNYTLSINVYAPNYNTTLTLADLVVDAMVLATGVFVSHASGQPVFNDQNEFYIQQTFNIKK